MKGHMTWQFHGAGSECNSNKLPYKLQESIIICSKPRSPVSKENVQSNMAVRYYKKYKKKYIVVVVFNTYKLSLILT